MIALLLFATVFLFNLGSGCDLHGDCRKCIKDPTCGWYFNPKSTNNDTGCYEKDDLERKNFVQDFIFAPKTELTITSEDRTASISPQSATLVLLINDTATIPITVKASSAKVHIKHDKPKATSFKINFYSNCGGKHDSLMQTKKCKGVRPGSSIEFLAKITAARCPVNGRFQHTIQIGLDGKNEKKMDLVLNLVCSCPCEMPPFNVIKRKAKECSRRGGYKCGVCKCEPGFVGSRCEKEEESGEASEDSE